MSSSPSSLEERRHRLEVEVEERRSAVEALLLQKQSMKTTLKQMTEDEEELNTLLVELANTKKDEEALKKDLRHRLDAMQRDNELLKSKLDKETNEDNVEDDHEHLKEQRSRLTHLRSQLARVGREAFEKDQQIDALPSDAEVDQYHQRLLELDEQVGLSYTQTRQSYALYNDLQTRKMYLEEFVALFESVLHNLPLIKSELSLKQGFLTHMTQLNKKLNSQTCLMLDKARVTERQRLDQVDQQLRKCRQLNRVYEDTKDNLHQAVKRHAQLKEQLHSLHDPIRNEMT